MLPMLLLNSTATSGRVATLRYVKTASLVQVASVVVEVSREASKEALQVVAVSAVREADSAAGSNKVASSRVDSVVVVEATVVDSVAVAASMEDSAEACVVVTKVEWVVKVEVTAAELVVDTTLAVVVLLPHHLMRSPTMLPAVVSDRRSSSSAM
jgi:hypothetical protein